MKRLITWCVLLLPLSISAETYQVTSVNDEPPDGCQIQDCTLREAIIAANQNPGEDTVLLNDSTYFLYQQGPEEDFGVSGDLDVLDDLRIVGKFTATEPLDVLTLLETNQLGESVFEVHENVSFYMEQVVLKNSNVIGTFGGGIKATNAQIDLNQVVFSQNEARKGGGIYSFFSQLTIRNSVFENNYSNSEGGAIMLIGGSLSVEDSFFIGNQALTNGGGIHASFVAHQNHPTINLDHVFVINNYAQNSGGGLFLSGTENMAADILINRTLIQNNEAQFGGGLSQEGSINLEIKASSLFTNRAAAQGNINTANGGAIMLRPGATPFIPQLFVENTTFYENFAEDEAGAIFSSSGLIELLNVTLSQNQAENYSTLLSNSSSVKFSHVTAYGNNAFNDIDFIIDDDSHLTLVNNLLMAQCSLNRRNTDSLGGNIESPNNTCGIGEGANDSFGVSPTLLLDPSLSLNGGPTATHAINTTSAALDNGVPLNTTSTDQRYMLRDINPDSGAFERQPFEFDLIFKNGFEI
ncbi:choice-of-anchor Q domain-containing protein [Marinicella sp. W31]|uniref:choice-of-anchor Q domain-containing protein n=1 Tax=Marinicella sp. W31 TaxID=3023713 RepID=UPI0037564257